MVAEAHTDGGVDVADYVAMIAGRLYDQVADISGSINAALADNIAELPGDDAMVEMLYRAVEVNVETVLRALLDDTPVEQTTVPQASIDYAKGLVRHDVPANALVRAYRLGQRRMTDLILSELHAVDVAPATRVAVIETITRVLFKYVDAMSQRLIVIHHGERERLVVNQSTAREAQIQNLVDGDAPVLDDDQADAASAALGGYPLRWQHLALLAWYSGDPLGGDDLALLRQFVRDLARAVDVPAGPLVTVAGSTAWVWLPYRSAPGDLVVKIRDFVRARPDAPKIAIGAMGSGVQGFRRSHRQAQRARDAASARDGHDALVTAATDPGIIAPALLAASVEEVRGWVADVLGALATDTAQDAQLRQTLRVFLQHGSGYQAAAEELETSPQALRTGVEQAVARRGRPIDNPLDVEAALIVCHWYGDAVLQPG